MNSSVHSISSASESDELELVARAARVHQQSTSVSSRFSRTWNILRYYRMSQLAIRTMNLLVRRKQTTVKYAEPNDLSTRSQAEFSKLAEVRFRNHYRSIESVRSDLSKDQVRVLNQTMPLDWKDGGNGSLLWLFQLHYHEYLLALAGDSTNSVNRTLIKDVISSWIDENPIGSEHSHRAAWHPYCISRRLPVWFCILSTDILDNATKQNALKSAYQQASHLAANLEWDLRGNHLLENLRALALAGAFFDSSNSWLQQVHNTLSSQLKEQTLEWGEHFERCPMYHCQILGNLLETMIVTKTTDPQLNETIRPVAIKMFRFLEQILHPDNEIPLLGDSCFGEAPSVTCIRQLAELAELKFPTPLKSITKSLGPYWIHRDRENFLIFDRGDAGASTLPAHAHCDLQTIEASVGGKRLIVDSGLYNYENDPMRWYCRSSIAHNVVNVEDQNQLDVWSKFRMGYRGSTSQLRSGSEQDFQWASCSHNAYRRFGVPMVSRLIGVKPGQFWYCADFAPRNNGKSLSGMLHFSPETKIFEESDGRFRLEIDENSFELSFFGISKVTTTSAWYCPEFGLREKNFVLEYSFIEDSLAASGWLLSFDLPQNSTLNIERSSGSKPAFFHVQISSNDLVQHKFQWTSQ